MFFQCFETQPLYLLESLCFQKLGIYFQRPIDLFNPHGLRTNSGDFSRNVFKSIIKHRMNLDSINTF